MALVDDGSTTDAASGTADGGPGPATPAGPGPQAPAARPWVRPLVAGAAVACGCAAIALVNPGDTGTSVCWSKSLLGVDCPFCGGLRCVNALVRGDWLAAADHNVLLAVVLPLVAIGWLVTLVRALQGRPIRWPRIPPAGFIGIAVFLVAFTVARNVGGPAWINWLNSATYRS
jgi:hypothetical protein